jgi:hypothetical protein
MFPTNERFQEQLSDLAFLLTIRCAKTIPTLVNTVRDPGQINACLGERSRKLTIFECIFINRLPSVHGKVIHGYARLLLIGAILGHVDSYGRWCVPSLQFGLLYIFLQNTIIRKLKNMFDVKYQGTKRKRIGCPYGVGCGVIAEPQN